MAPRLVGQAIRIPSRADTTEEPTLGTDTVQLRASLTWSPLDLYRGVQVMRLADLRCERDASMTSLQEALAAGNRYGRAHALVQQIAHLEASLPAARALIARAEEQLAAGVATLLEVDQLRVRVHRLQRQLARARQELAILEIEEMDGVLARPLAGDVAKLERADVAMVRGESDLRKLDAWNVDIRAGAVPDDSDWFAMLQVSYSLGDPWRRRAEARLVDAHKGALRDSRDGSRSRAARFVRTMRTSVVQLREELALVRRQLEILAAEQDSLEQTSSDRAQSLVARITLDRFELEAEARFLETLIHVREAVTGEKYP